MTKSITVERQQASNFAEKKYTVGLDLGDRWSWYCVLDERGEVVFERKVSTTPKALREVFGASRPPQDGVLITRCASAEPCRGLSLRSLDAQAR
jgi:hypothetical protein